MGSKTSSEFLDVSKSNSLREASLSGVLDPFLIVPNYLLYKMTDSCTFADDSDTFYIYRHRKLVKSSYQIPDKLINNPIDPGAKNVHFMDSSDISLVFKGFMLDQLSQLVWSPNTILLVNEGNKRHLLTPWAAAVAAPVALLTVSLFSM